MSDQADQPAQAVDMGSDPTGDVAAAPDAGEDDLDPDIDDLVVDTALEPLDSDLTAPTGGRRSAGPAKPAKHGSPARVAAHDNPTLRSPILRGLRTRADEIQLARVLLTLTREPAVAKHLLTGILQQLPGDTAHDLLETLPDNVHCLDEQMVSAPVGGGVLRRRSRAGRVDLDFRGPAGWRLLVELKINNPLTQLQIDKYAPVAPTVALVRATERSPPPRDEARWLGAVSWQVLLPTLRSLPLAAPLAAQWHDLAILEDDGDFAPVAQGDTAEDHKANELLRPLNESLVGIVASALDARHGTDARALIDCLGVTDVTTYRGRWTGFALYATAEDANAWLIQVLLRNAYDRQPTLAVVWNAPKSKRPRQVRRTVDDAIRHLLPHSHVQKRPNGNLRWEKPVDPDSLDTEVEAVATELIRAGAFALDVDNWQP